MAPASMTAQLPGSHLPRWNRGGLATRHLLAYHALFDFSLGLGIWLQMLLASLLCSLYILGCHSSARRCASVLLPPPTLLGDLPQSEAAASDTECLPCDAARSFESMAYLRRARLEATRHCYSLLHLRDRPKTERHAEKRRAQERRAAAAAARAQVEAMRKEAAAGRSAHRAARDLLEHELANSQPSRCACCSAPCCHRTWFAVKSIAICALYCCAALPA